MVKFKFLLRKQQMHLEGLVQLVGSGASFIFDALKD